MSSKWNPGDVFLVPLNQDSIGLGQVVDVLPSELYVTLFGKAWDIRSLPSPDEALSQAPFLASLTLDAKLHHGDWIVIGNVTENLARIDRPISKVRISGEMFVESHDGSWKRRATVEEAYRLPFRTTVAPVRLENALKALHGIVKSQPSYEGLRYSLIVESARIARRR